MGATNRKLTTWAGTHKVQLATTTPGRDVTSLLVMTLTSRSPSKVQRHDNQSYGVYMQQSRGVREKMQCSKIDTHTHTHTHTHTYTQCMRACIIYVPTKRRAKRPIDRPPRVSTRPPPSCPVQRDSTRHTKLGRTVPRLEFPKR